jgi:integrase
MKMRFTDATIAALDAGGKRARVRDSELGGFVMRLAKSTKTFCYEYRRAGAGRSMAPVTLKIGCWPSIREAQARKLAQALAVSVAAGGDPRRERRERAERQTKSLKHLLAPTGPYEMALRGRSVVNWRPALSSLRRELAGLMDHDPAALTRADLVRCIGALAAAGKPGAARDLRKFSVGFCEWSVASGYAPSNPLAGWRAPAATRAEKLAKVTAGRALADAETIKLWRAADAAATPFAGLVQTGLLTGLRRGELAGLKWTDVHADRIVLEAGATKTGQRHEVPLTDLMRGVLARQPKMSDFIFASPSGGRLTSWKHLVAALREKSGVEFNLHDTRRSTRTTMSRLEIPEDHAELAIGHLRAALVAKYNRDDAWRHRLAAFAAVSEHIGKLIESTAAPGKVVALPARPSKK